MASLAQQTEDLVMRRERERFDLAVRKIVRDLLDEAPVDTGETRNKTGVERTSTAGTQWSAEVSSRTPQAKFTDEGTGIFGPQGRLIVPNRPGGVLHWIDKVTGGDVFARSSRGSGRHKGWFSTTVKGWAGKLQRS